MMSYIRWIPAFRITQEHRKNHFCLKQWLNVSAQGAVLERHTVFPRSILLASNCPSSWELWSWMWFVRTYKPLEDLSPMRLSTPGFNRNFLRPEHLLTRHSTIHHPFQSCHSPASACQDLVLRHCTNCPQHSQIYRTPCHPSAFSFPSLSLLSSHSAQTTLHF